MFVACVLNLMRCLIFLVVLAGCGKTAVPTATDVSWNESRLRLCDKIAFYRRTIGTRYEEVARDLKSPSSFGKIDSCHFVQVRAHEIGDDVSKLIDIATILDP